MKLCACCGAECRPGEPTCPDCGEASWLSTGGKLGRRRKERKRRDTLPSEAPPSAPEPEPSSVVAIEDVSDLPPDSQRDTDPAEDSR